MNPTLTIIIPCWNDFDALRSALQQVRALTGIAEIIVSKQRNGPIGTVRLAFLGEYTRFENLAQSGTY